MPPKGKGKGKPAGPGGPGEEAKAGEKISEVEKEFFMQFLMYKKSLLKSVTIWFPL